MTRTRRIFARICLVLGGLVLAFALGEATVRILDLPPRMLDALEVGTYRLSSNPVIKFEYQPGYRPDQRPFDERHQNFKINSDGFRDYEFPTTREPGVTRVVVLGDSITAGNGVVDVDDVYPRRLGRLLSEQAGRVYEVLNFGVGGYDTLQEVETLRVKALRFQPDIVLVGFCLNDFVQADGGVFIKLMRQRAAPEKARRHPLELALSRSRLLFFLYHRTRQLLSGGALRAKGAPSAYVYRYKGTTLRGEDPVEVGLALLDLLQKENGFQVYVAIVPGFDRPFSEYRHLAVHEKLLGLAKAYPAIKVLDLLEGFKATGADAVSLSYDGVHPTAEGQRILAELIAKEMLAKRGP